MSRRLLRALLIGVVLLVLPSSASAHAALKSADPGPGEKVVGSPDELVLRFDQNLDPSRTSIEVLDASGARVARGGEIGDGPRIFKLALPELAPGVYEVRWTTLSAEDNELFRDNFTFEVLAAPSLAPTARPATPGPSASAAPTVSIAPPSSAPASGPPDGGADPQADAAALIPVVAVLLLVAGLGFWLRRRRP